MPNHSLRKASESLEQRRDEQPMAIDPARLAVSEELLGEGMKCTILQHAKCETSSIASEGRVSYREH